MTRTFAEANQRPVLEAFDTLFDKRDYHAAVRFWSPNYIQHSAHIPPGREALLELTRSAPPALRYGAGLQEEATREESQSGRPMFGTEFAP